MTMTMLEVLLAVLLLLAAPAAAQRDQMALGEQLGATVQRARVTAPAPPAPCQGTPATAQDRLQVREEIQVDKK
jgi:hypothetical protein